MRRADAVHPSPLALLLLLATAVLLGWCIVRAAANDLWSVARPERAALFWPASGDALAAMAQARIVAAGGHVDDRSRALAAQALRRAPVGADPLILAGLAASERGDLPRAEALMMAARARDPRAVVARSWLLDHFMRSGDYVVALGEVGAELRLRPDTQGPVLAILSALLAMPRGVAALRQALLREPDWRTAFFTTAPQYGADPAALAALLVTIPPAHDPAAAAIEQGAVLRAQIDRGDYAAAYRTWQHWVSVRVRGAAGPIYDPEFAGSPGPAPFNWSLQPGTGVARIEPLAGAAGRDILSLAAGDDEGALLAEQYAMADPGDYAFAVLARQVAAGDTRLIARFVCARDASVLAALPLDGLGPRFAVHRTAVGVPARCGAIRVQMLGMPGDGGPGAEVQIAAVRLSGR